MDLLFKHSENILIKTSPLLDLTVGIKELKQVKTIHVVAVNNEVKELLWILKRDSSEDISIKTVNIRKDKSTHFDFLIDEESRIQSNYNKPLAYLYEPNSAILKAGGFDTISNKLHVFKLHQHSHLYTSETLLEFPGRGFKIENVLPFNKKIFKKEGITKANITTRNFPETVQNIRKKLHIKDGGNLYLFFTTDVENNKIVIVCTKTN